MVWVDGEQYLLPYPPLADGNWHSVSAQFGPETVEIAVDVLYKKVPKATKAGRGDWEEILCIERYRRKGNGLWYTVEGMEREGI